MMWVGLEPITPSRSFLPWTMTRCEVSVFGSKPPSGLKRMKPLSSTWVTMKPISSMWAAAIERFTDDLPFFKATTLPMLSTRTSSARPSISLSTSSRMIFSNPGAPGASQTRESRATSMAMSRKLGGRPRPWKPEIRAISGFFRRPPWRPDRETHRPDPRSHRFPSESPAIAGTKARPAPCPPAFRRDRAFRRDPPGDRRPGRPSPVG